MFHTRCIEAARLIMPVGALGMNTLSEWLSWIKELLSPKQAHKIRTVTDQSREQSTMPQTRQQQQLQALTAAASLNSNTMNDNNKQGDEASPSQPQKTAGHAAASNNGPEEVHAKGSSKGTGKPNGKPGPERQGGLKNDQPDDDDEYYKPVSFEVNPKELPSKEDNLKLFDEATDNTAIVGYQYYRPKIEVRQGLRQFTKSTVNTGVSFPKKNPVLVNYIPDRDEKWWSNEPQNLYYNKVVVRMANHWNPAYPEKDFGVLVFKEEVHQLTELAGMKHEDGTDRQKDMFWRVICAFKFEDPKKIGNEELHGMTIIYAKMRTGVILSRGSNEVTTAIDAIKYRYKEVSQESSLVWTTWCFPLLLLLNEHIAHFTDIPPIRYHMAKDLDKAYDEQRNHDTELIWIEEKRKVINMKVVEGRKKRKKVTEHHDVKVPYGIERRGPVREQLLKFLNKHRGNGPEVQMRQGVDGPGTTPAAAKQDSCGSFDCHWQE